jgi:tetratricopeptide (TPR) repeat protein
VHPQAKDYYDLALSCNKEGNSEAAEYYFHSALEFGNDARIFHALGLCCAQKEGRELEAFRLFRRAIRTNAEFADAYNDCGVMLLRLGMFQKSAKWFHKALKINSKERKHFALYNLAVLYKKMRRPERSIRYLHLALKLEKDFFQAKKLLQQIEGDRTDDSFSRSN